MRIRRESVRNVRKEMVERVTVDWPNSSAHAEFDNPEEADAFIAGLELAQRQMIKFLVSESGQ